MSEGQDQSSALKAEQANLATEIARIYAELKKHAAAFESVGRKLNEYAEQVVLDKGKVWVQGRPSNFIFAEELFDIRKVGELTHQLRIRIDRSVEIEDQLRQMEQ